MKPTQITNPTVTLAALQKALISSPKNLEKKYLALQLILTGKSHKETCRILSIGRNTLTRWIKLVNDSGMDGLMPTKKIGRPSKLKEEDYKTIQDALKMSPSECGVRGKKWTGSVFRRYLKSQFGANFSLSASYKIYNKISASSLRESIEETSESDYALSLIIKTYRAKLVHNLAMSHAP
jgi:transposase